MWNKKTLCILPIVRESENIPLVYDSEAPLATSTLKKKSAYEEQCFMSDRLMSICFLETLAFQDRVLG